MNPKKMFYMFCLVMFTLLPAGVSAEALTGEELLAQVDKNLEPGDLSMYRKIINIEPEDRKSVV